MLLRSFNKSCFWVTAPKVTEAERLFHLHSRMVLHITQRLLLQLLASVLPSREILDFGQQLSVCVDGIIQGKATE